MNFKEKLMKLLTETDVSIDCCEEILAHILGHAICATSIEDVEKMYDKFSHDNPDLSQPKNKDYGALMLRVALDNLDNVHDDIDEHRLETIMSGVYATALTREQD